MTYLVRLVWDLFCSIVAGWMFFLWLRGYTPAHAVREVQ